MGCRGTRCIHAFQSTVWPCLFKIWNVMAHGQTEVLIDKSFLSETPRFKPRTHNYASTSILCLYKSLNGDLRATLRLAIEVFSARWRDCWYLHSRVLWRSVWNQLAPNPSWRPDSHWFYLRSRCHENPIAELQTVTRRAVLTHSSTCGPLRTESCSESYFRLQLNAQ